MNPLREVYEAEAAVARRAVPMRTLGHFHLDEDARQLVLYQLAANDFSVIGLALGRPGRRPDHLAACPDPLSRNDVAARLQPVRDALLEWLDGHVITPDSSNPARVGFHADSAPQLVLPGAGAIMALDNLAYDWRFNQQLDEDWHRLGEELWNLLSVYRRPGQSVVVPLAETLTEHWALGISGLEAAKLAVDVALVEADRVGLRPDQLHEAEAIEAGPLGRPDLIDEPVWAAMAAGRRKAPPVVRQTLLETWGLCNRAWRLLRALPEAPSAVHAGEECASAWATRTGPARTELGFRRRRALPALGSAAAELGQLERIATKLASQRALEDPLIAAELATDGKAVRANLQFVATRDGRSTIITITGDADQHAVPPAGALLGVAGTNVVARLQNVGRHQGGWDIALEVSGRERGTTGIRTAQRLGDGVYWLVAVPEPGPPALPPPSDPPATHPTAAGRAA